MSDIVVTKNRSVGVYVIDSSNRFVLAQRGPEARHGAFTWEGPGGAVDEGEDFSQAAIREYREELGMDIQIVDVLLEKLSVVDTNGVDWHNKVFIATSEDTPMIMEPGKIIGVGRFTVDEMFNLPLASYVQEHDLPALAARYGNL